MKKILSFLIFLASASLLLAQESSTVAFANMLRGDTVAQAVSAVSTDTPLVVKYIGSSAIAKLAVDASTGDLTFTQGAVGTETDTTLECPVSGALGGVIDVSNAACDTLGEVVDIINASTDWRAVIVDGLRADSANNTLITLAADAGVQAPGGLGLLNDGTVSLTMTRALTDKRTMASYLGGGNTLLVNPFRGERTVAYQFSATTTYSSGTSTLQVISVKPDIRNGSETATVVWSAAGGATTVLGTLNFQPFGIFGRKDEKLLVRVLNSAVMTAATGNAYGNEYKYQQ